MFVQTLLTSLIKMVFLGAVAFAGIMLGKKMRDQKDAKSEKDA